MVDMVKMFKQIFLLYKYVLSTCCQYETPTVLKARQFNEESDFLCLNKPSEIVVVGIHITIYMCV